jgi:hypothetical protein
MRTLPLLLALLPGTALADCVYTGAKRAYLECIYTTSLQAASDIATLAADFLGLTGRVDEAETRLTEVETDLTTEVGAVQTDLSALQADVAALDGTLASLLLDVGGLQSDVADLQSSDSAQSSQISDLQSTATSLTSSLGALSAEVATLSSTLSALDGDVESGYYTPTATADQAVNSLQVSRGMYTRIGDIVHVSVRLEGISSSTAEKVVFLSLPIASGAPLTPPDVIGPCVNIGSGGETVVGHGGAIYKSRGGASATQVEVRWYDDNTAGQGTGAACSFQYTL